MHMFFKKMEQLSTVGALLLDDDGLPWMIKNMPASYNTFRPLIFWKMAKFDIAIPNYQFNARINIHKTS